MSPAEPPGAGPSGRVPYLGCLALGLLAAAWLASGCGKSNLPRRTGSTAAATPKQGRPHRAGPAPGGAPAIPLDPVPLPLALTSARATAFARAVELVPVDVPGATVGHEGHPDSQEEREAARCGKAASVLASDRSPKLHRGTGLAQEDISSSTEVLGSLAAVRSNLAYLRSRTGLRCYSRVLRAGLGREEGAGLRLLGLRIGRLQVTGGSGGGQGGEGLRIEAGVGLRGTAKAVPVYIDAVSFDYGPAEIDLYATSFVQPVPLSTEQQLLKVLRERASLQRL